MISYSTLVGVFEEERKRLGLPEIELVVTNPPRIEDYESLEEYLAWFDVFSTAAILKEDGTFRIQIHPKNCTTMERFMKTIRHELYHVYRDESNNGGFLSLLKYLFISEPRAMAYASLGIRL